MPVYLLLLPAASTLLGGVFTIRMFRWVPVLLAVGTGLLLGATFLDLLPEALNLSGPGASALRRVPEITLLSYLAFLALDGFLERLGSLPGIPRSAQTSRRAQGAMLIFHSFRDGLAIGASFTASHAAGYSVAAGICVHDFGDGMNSILLTTSGKQPGRVDYAFLLADAAAPVAGGLAARWWLSSPADSVVLLAVAAGFFLQMVSGDFMPQIRQSAVPRLRVTAAVVSGVALIYAANVLIARVR